MPACSALVLAIGLQLGGCGGDGSDPPRTDTAAPAQWVAIAVEATRKDAVVNPPGLGPVFDARAFAMAFIASHDALNAIERRYAPYLSDLHVPNASPDAAVAAAVYTVMANQVPSQADYLKTQYDQALAALPESDAKSAGITLGRQTAQAMLDSRANDGSAQANEPAYTYTVAPGVYQPTPPFTTGFLTGWSRVKPFVLKTAAQFRPPVLYSLTSPEYTADFNEVKSLGSATSTTRTADQSQIAKFWLEDTSQSWAMIAAALGPARHLDGWAQARLFAVLEAAQSDGYVAGLEAKYHYNFWRPITAIREADGDGNGATVADPNWISFDPVAPPVPDYPSTHSTSAGAGKAVLQATMGDTVDVKYSSSSLPGVVRSYKSVSQIADEIGASRIYVGYHFRNAVTQGLTLGQSVGAYVESHTMQRQ